MELKKSGKYKKHRNANRKQKKKKNGGERWHSSYYIFQFLIQDMPN